MKIYLDLCCLNRPFDDQTQRRVSFEAQAVELILESLKPGGHQLCGSTALIVENQQNPKADRRSKIEELLKQANIWVPHSRALDRRVLELRKLGFREFDAYHVACAEAGSCNRLVTCDDQFLKVARRNSAKIDVIVSDPLSLLAEADF